MLGISYREHKTNEYVWQQVNILAGHQELLLPTAKLSKLSRFSYICRHDTRQKEKPTNCGTKAADLLATFLAGQL